MIAHSINMNMPKSQLGESPYWDEYMQCLYWTDIKGKLIYRYYPLLEKVQSCQTPKMVAFVLKTQNGELIAGLEDGLYKADFEKETFEPITLLNEKDVRLNDGKCDPVGRIWFGTMPLDEESEQKLAKLYRVTNEIKEMDQNFGIANGKAWTKDGKYFYHIDTSSKIIWRYPYDVKDGGIGEKEEFIRTESAPDGMCIDSEGNLYVALYGEGAVDVFSATGQKQYSIKVPAKEVTSCAFGGADLKTLYITTAKDGLFQIRINIAGLLECPASI